jgi:hypothetical protein
MEPFEERKRRQGQFMALLYEKTGGTPTEMTDPFALGKEMGLSEEETSKLVDYLHGKYLVEWKTTAWIGITALGVLEVEQALEKPEQPTEHFAPFNVIQIGQMIGSEIQQGTVGSTQQQNVLDGEELATIRLLIEEFLNHVMPKLEGSDHQDAQAQIDTIKSQLRSPHPRRTIVRESLQTLRSLAENMAAGAALQTILHHFQILGV